MSKSQTLYVTFYKTIAKLNKVELKKINIEWNVTVIAADNTAVTLIEGTLKKQQSNHQHLTRHHQL